MRQQDAFFVHGIEHLRPLNLKTVAEAIEMHESTVSRVTSNKYIGTPRGIFELKYFFTSAISSSQDGEAYSSESVRFKIKQLIDAEPPTRSSLTIKSSLCCDLMGSISQGAPSPNTAKPCASPAASKRRRQKKMELAQAI